MRNIKLFLAVALTACLVFPTLALPAPALAQSSPLQTGQASLSTQAKASKSGWKKTKNGKKYYRKGKALTGLQKIKGKFYYFGGDGILETKDVKVGSTVFYINKNGSLLGAKYRGHTYYKTLKRMSKTDEYNFKTYIMARSIVQSITKKCTTKKQKIRKVFAWVVKQKYAVHVKFNPHQANWIPYHARYHLKQKKGDCHADGGALGYMFSALGYKPKVALDYYDTVSHCWVEMNGKAYDSVFAGARGYENYYAIPVSKFEYKAAVRFDVPWFYPSNAARGAKVPAGLLKAGKSQVTMKNGTPSLYLGGKKARNVWKTIDGKKYYFKKNGKAATLSTKIDGKYYVFDEKGVLQSSKKAGKRIVTIAGVAYQVNKNGQAKSGWSSDKTRRFGATGAVLTGVSVIKGAFYAADDKGIYQRERTNELNASAKVGARATALRRLLGTPKEEAYSASCDFAGDDGLWSYDGFVVTTRRPTATAKLFASIEDAMAAEDTGTIDMTSAFESIASIEAA